MTVSLSAWLFFFLLLIGLVYFDLGIWHKKNATLSVRSSLALSLFYIIIALLYGVWLGWHYGKPVSFDYFTAYWVEKSLSVDNLFVMLLIFEYFKIPQQYQHKVLFWGILGVLVFRGIFITAGIFLVEEFSFILYIFGAFLIWTGLKIFYMRDQAFSLEKSRILRYFRHHLPLTEDLHGGRFLVKVPQASPKAPFSKKFFFTPLFLALITIEILDLVFALDSIPAVFAITTVPFIVYTSNIFAILGLRALYFAMHSIIMRFHYIKYALALILMMIGIKIYIPHIFPFIVVPRWFYLLMTLGLLLAGILFSLYKTRRS